jgi:hypothetical protein
MHDAGDANTPIAPGEFEAYVARIKQQWRIRASELSWEDKIAAIQRMRERSAALAVARELVRKKLNETALDKHQPPSS